ncbi:MAG: hypothetical protein EP329_19830 [Deltaproteobacteria bacterium]|nr:MAG: hypothetical protein EP329_19830 [Deltaproteobacteria bacterium]
MTAPAPLEVTKASGEREPFSAEKLTRSLLAAGAEPELARRVVERVTQRMEPAATTRRIYRDAFRLLHREVGQVATRYSLKQAILRLGPTGYPFERLWGSVLEAEGYTVTYNRVVPGRCVSHEVDVEAQGGGQTFGYECKYHSRKGRNSDLKVALYVGGRAQDLREGPERFTGFGLVTNTRLTSDALTYGRCAGLRMVDWGNPVGHGLKDLVERHGLLPVSCLVSIRKEVKLALLEAGIVLCRDLAADPDRIDTLDVELRPSARRDLIRELESLEPIWSIARP